MSGKLSMKTIRQRLVEWRNYKQLHAAQKKRNRKLETEIRQLRKLYERDTQTLKTQLETALLRIADLEKMVFGEKKKDRNSSSGHSSSNKSSQDKDKQPRSKKSYQRPQPDDQGVTDTKHHPVTACNHCGGPLSRFEEVIRYVEDIILPQLIGKLTKTVTKHIIERGYCANCGVWSAAHNLRGSVVQLGRNVKLLVTYLVTILDCSYEQVKTLTHDLYGLELSDGEIVNLLQEKAKTWQPEYHRLLGLIRAGPGAHLDETTWPIQTLLCLGNQCRKLTNQDLQTGSLPR